MNDSDRISTHNCFAVYNQLTAQLSMCTFLKPFKFNPTEELKPIPIQKNTYHFDIVKDKLFNCNSYLLKIIIFWKNGSFTLFIF